MMSAFNQLFGPLRSSVYLSSKRMLRSVSKPGKLVVQPSVDIPSPGADRFARFLRATGFCVGVSGATYVGCAIWQYESVRKNLQSIPGFGRIFPLSQPQQPFWQDKVRAMWSNLSDGKKLVVWLISANCVVFLLWQLRTLQPIMRKYFLSDPAAKRIGLPTLLSVFSHIAPFHLFCNMYVLWSFSDAAIHMFGKEQFLFFYVSAGLFAGTASLLNKLSRGIAQPSLGASGAIIAALAAVCTAYPNSKLSIIFLPMYPFDAGSALNALVLFESLAVLLKWRFFDHAAHLGGLLFGIWYVNYGHELTWGKRQQVIQWWHKVRGHTGT